MEDPFTDTYWGWLKCWHDHRGLSKIGEVPMDEFVQVKHWGSASSLSETQKKHQPHHKSRLVLMDAVLEMLRGKNLSIFAEAGTLLGAWRKGKMVPWDDDVDFAVANR